MIEDISNWKKDETKEATGTREKFWLINPQTEKNYLFKLPTENTGEIWAEKIAAEVEKIMGLKMMNVEIATYQGRKGLLLENFVDYGNEEFYNGGDLLDPIVENFDPKYLPHYTFSNIVDSLVAFSFEGEIIKIIIFDALIANQDRHCENWGVIQKNVDGQFRFAPIFDNGASLGFNNTEERVHLMFKDKNMFESFTNKGKSTIGVESVRKRPKIKVLLEEVHSRFPEIVKNEIQRLEYLQKEGIKHIVNSLPSEVISETHKIWVEKLLLYRKEWLINWYKGELGHD
ncbi:toxin HipA [Bacillus megaterium]|uniref:HipA domain-containing protein n=1 Tax=Priestia megaterium TaxID=1404 RepID=UPI001292DA8D|nr:HipA domain-containing protein [Priestia megaterium]MQR87047.1 toxin HipA [Priestia megaterium]